MAVSCKWFAMIHILLTCSCTMFFWMLCILGDFVSPLMAVILISYQHEACFQSCNLLLTSCNFFYIQIVSHHWRMQRLMDPSEARSHIQSSDQELPPLYESVNSKDSEEKPSRCLQINRTLLPFKAFYYFFYAWCNRIPSSFHSTLFQTSVAVTYTSRTVSWLEANHTIYYYSILGICRRQVQCKENGTLHWLMWMDVCVYQPSPCPCC